MLKKISALALSGMMGLGILVADASAMTASIGGAVAATVPAVATDNGVVEKAQYWRHRHRHYRGPRYIPAPRYVPRARARMSARHVAWCNARYRSYRSWDNTFQPYHGPRRQCRSPYWG